MAKDAAGPSKTWLTQEAFDRLSAELAHLSVAGREEVVAKIAAAREEGDLKENGGYHAAREEQERWKLASGNSNQCWKIQKLEVRHLQIQK